jgi:hypothetical protein
VIADIPETIAIVCVVALLFKKVRAQHLRPVLATLCASIALFVILAAGLADQHDSYSHTSTCIGEACN